MLRHVDSIPKHFIMKTYKVFVVLILLLPFIVSSQIENLGDMLKEAAKEMGEVHGENRPAGDNAQNQNAPRSESDNQRMQEWEEFLDENMSAIKDGLDHFNTKETACIFMMVVYLDSYFKLVHKTEATSDCETKYDLYGMQTMAIAGSTTIMYCPENLWNMTIDEREAVYEDDLVPILRNEDNDPFVTEWKEKLRRVTRTNVPEPEQSPYGGDLIAKLCHFFSPGYILPALLSINQKMEALGCGG